MLLRSLLALATLSATASGDQLVYVIKSQVFDTPPEALPTGIGPTNTTFSQTGVMPAFDPALGTLQAAALKVEWVRTYCNSLSNTNTRGANITWQGGFSGGGSATVGPLTLPMAPMSLPSSSYPLSLSPGSAGSSVCAFDQLWFNPSVMVGPNGPQGQALVGSGTMPYVVPYEIQVSMSNWYRTMPGLSVIEHPFRIYARVELTYTYSPPVPMYNLAVGTGDGGDQLGCTDCPCGNNAPVGTVGGCLNSEDRSARVIASGAASIAADSLRFRLNGGTSNSFSILVSGSALLPQNPANPCFGLDSGVISANLDGLRVVGGSVLRHGVRATDATGSVGFLNAGWGPPDNPIGGLAAQAGFVAGEQRHFQVFYRDLATAGCGTGQNTSQAVSVAFTP